MSILHLFPRKKPILKNSFCNFYYFHNCLARMLLHSSSTTKCIWLKSSLNFSAFYCLLSPTFSASNLPFCRCFFSYLFRQVHSSLFGVSKNLKCSSFLLPLCLSSPCTYTTCRRSSFFLSPKHFCSCSVTAENKLKEHSFVFLSPVVAFKETQKLGFSKSENCRLFSSCSFNFLYSSSAHKKGHLISENWFIFSSKRHKKWLPFYTSKKKKALSSSSQTLEGSFSLGKKNEENKKNENNTNLITGLSVVKEEIDAPIYLTPYQAINLIKALHFVVDYHDLDSRKYIENKKITLRLKLNVDLTRESIRGSCQLPHGLSEDIRLLVFCKDEQSEEMISYGANYAGLRNLIERISKGWIGFDKCIASPEVMNQIVKLAKILGPLKLMPNLKSKTITMNLKETILAFKAGGLVEYRAELNDEEEKRRGGEGSLKSNKVDGNFGYIKVHVGKLMQSNQQILDNISFFVKEILKSRKKAGGGFSSEISSEFKWPPRRKKNRLDTAARDEKQSLSSSASSSDFILGGQLLLDDCAAIHMYVHSILPNSVGYFR